MTPEWQRRKTTGMKHRCVGLACLAAVAVFVNSCSDTQEFCCGYSVKDQGGSKHSLMRSGLVVESYIVTGVLPASNLTVFELRPYGAENCRYRIAAPPRQLSSAMPLTRLDEVRAGLSDAVQSDAFQPLSSRSCASEPSGSS